MARGKCTWTMSEVTRAYRAADKAGVKVIIEIERGKMRLIPAAGGESIESDGNDLDRELAEFKTRRAG